jgi:hypothetical protein
VSSASDRCYELLGVRPGVSPLELKAAYRDLTKVWHPDRFAHDPRLQEKAQEKLKEINDAYEQLVSGKIRPPRVVAQSPGVHRTEVRDFSEPARSYSPAVVVKSRSLAWLMVPLIVFGCVFVFTIRFIQIKGNQQRSVIEEPASETTAEIITDTAADNEQPARKSGETSVVDPRPIEDREIPTTTVMIDSTTGLLARAECPTKIRMTYPSGNEPRAYCTAHPISPAATNPQHQSKLKSLEKKSPSTEVADQSEKNQPER